MEEKNKYFAKPGESVQQFGGDCPAGWVLMESERPGIEHIASDDGRWIPPGATVEGLKDRVTAHRWVIETGGLVLQSGVSVATGLDDQNRITTVVANARLAGLESVKFKAVSGWVTLSLAELEGVAAAVAKHVQTCFAAECEHHQAIDAIAMARGEAERQAQLDAYDITQGWPEN